MPRASLDRFDPAVAQSLVETLLRAPEPRGLALAAFARAIGTAQMVNPLSWAVNINAKEAKLNVGQLAVLHIRAEGLGCMVAEDTLGDVELSALPGYTYYGTATWIRDVHWGFFDEAHIASYRLVERATLELVKRAASKQREVRKASRDTHAPGLLEYLRREGHSVPSPAYDHHD